MSDFFRDRAAPLAVVLLCVLIAVFILVRLWCLRGSGKLPPIRARLLGAIGRNMDGDTLLSFSGSVWGRSPYTSRWSRFR